MIAPMAKVQIAAPRREKDAVLQFLQEEEVIHVVESEDPAEPVSTDTAYQLAQVQFGLEFIDRLRSRLAQPRPRNLRLLFSPKPMAAITDLEERLQTVMQRELLAAMQSASDRLVELDNEQVHFSQRVADLTPWQPLALNTPDLATTLPIEHALVAIATHDEHQVYDNLNEIPSSVWQEVHRVAEGKQLTLFGEIIIHRRDRQALEHFLQQPGVERIDLALNGYPTIADQLKSLHEQRQSLAHATTQLLQESARFLDAETDLKFAYDALLHRQEREELEQHLTYFAHTVVLTGWLPRPSLPRLIEHTARRFPHVAIAEIHAEPTDVPPVALLNRRRIRAFEAVTNIYGKPAYHELDPTPVLSVFFLLAFGLALTDAGYGLLMMAATWAAQRFFRLKREMRQMAQLLFYGGAATVVLGALTGGWFSINLEALPASPVRDLLLTLKILDPIQQPMVLLGVALAFGVVQLLFAWGVRGYHHWTTGQRLNVFLDDIPWITMVLFVLTWAAARRGVLPAAQASGWGWAAVANAVFLVATQGRSYRNPFLKLGSGIISLYNLVGFLSDTLSYSRLLALGLATGIIGLVVNLIAGLAADSIPIVGIVIAGGVLLVGHLFNLGINTLGAFIHSGRLQFVEFFPKFMEGGGVAYAPFGRVSRYVDNPREFA